MSEQFTFTDNGNSPTFDGPADIIIGDNENFGTGTLTLQLNGGGSWLSDWSITAPGQRKVDAFCQFRLVLSGATSPDINGLVLRSATRTV